MLLYRHVGARYRPPHRSPHSTRQEQHLTPYHVPMKGSQKRHRFTFLHHHRKPVLCQLSLQHTPQRHHTLQRRIILPLAKGKHIPFARPSLSRRLSFKLKPQSLCRRRGRLSPTTFHKLLRFSQMPPRTMIHLQHLPTSLIHHLRPPQLRMCCWRARQLKAWTSHPSLMG